MKSRSAKNKGKRLQNKVRDLILEKFNTLEDDEVRVIINSFLDKTLSIIKLVEDQMISHSDELIKMTKI